MNNRIQQSIIGGIVATLVMTIVMFLAPMMGLPKMNIGQMLSMLLGVPVFVGWIMHFMIGIIFALSYTFIFSKIVARINNKVLKGALFGLAVFVFAQIAIAIMGWLMGSMPPLEGSMSLIAIGSIIGHLFYGIVVTQFVKGPVVVYNQ
ncbi:MAG: DUF1440 domain-containing protein [Paludibacter sp.]|nr:DUF1440 domain-containing protein [Paludibacter sp.]